MPYSIVQFEIRDCCSASDQQEQEASNARTSAMNGVQAAQNEPFWVLKRPKFHSWTYMEGMNNLTHYVDWIANVEVDGNYTDYALARIDDRALDGSGENLIGDLVLEVTCEDFCVGDYKQLIQIGGTALEYYRRPSLAYLSRTCDNVVSLGPNSFYSWGLAMGDSATLVTMGGKGSFRRFSASDQVLTSNGASITNSTWTYDGFDSENDLTDNQVAQIQADGTYEIYTEANLTLEEMASIEVTANRPGTSLILCTDGIACTWGVFITAECSHCPGLGGSAPEDDPDESKYPIPRNDDYRIKRNGGGFCDCDTDDVDITSDVAALGGGETVERGTGDVINPYISEGHTNFQSGDIYFDHDQGNPVVMRPITHQIEVEVGDTYTFNIPAEISQDQQGNNIKWRYELLLAPALPDDGQETSQLWGAGWGYDYTGPMMSTNSDKKMWKIIKKKSSLELTAIAPTNHLPSLLQIWPVPQLYTNTTSIRQKENFAVPPSVKELYTIQTDRKSVV